MCVDALLVVHGALVVRSGTLIDVLAAGAREAFVALDAGIRAVAVVACRYYTRARTGILTLVNIHAKAVVILFEAVHAATTVVGALRIDALTMVLAAEVSVLL